VRSVAIIFQRGFRDALRFVPRPHVFFRCYATSTISITIYWTRFNTKDRNPVHSSAITVCICFARRLKWHRQGKPEMHFVQPMAFVFRESLGHVSARFLCRGPPSNEWLSTSSKSANAWNRLLVHREGNVDGFTRWKMALLRTTTWMATFDHIGLVEGSRQFGQFIGRPSTWKAHLRSQELAPKTSDKSTRFQ